MARAARGSDGTDYEAKLRSLRRTVSGMEGVCKPMAEDLLEAYAHIYADWHKLDRMLEEDGLLVVGPRGGMVKSPAFDMRRNCITQMADLANKIKRFVRDDSGPEDADDFAAF